MQKHKKYIETGRTMIEMLAVLGVIAVIGVGMAAGIGHGLMIYRASVIQTQLPQLAKVIADIQSFNIEATDSRFNYQDLFSDILGKSACTNDGCNTAAGPMSVELQENSFTITFTNMPKKICYELLTMGRGDENGPRIKGLIVEDVEDVEDNVDNVDNVKKVCSTGEVVFSSASPTKTPTE